MKKPITTALFVFFCLTLLACKEEITYRAIEISIINADHAEIKLYQLPDRKLIRQIDFDREYQQIVYLNNIPDGMYTLEVTSDEESQDTTFIYTGVIGLGVEF